MKPVNSYWILIPILLFVSACVETEIIPETLTPIVSIQPASVSIIVNQTAQLNATFTNEKGEDRSSELQWRSASNSIATVATGGFVTGVAPGQTWVIVTARDAYSDSTLVTVTSNPNQVAKVEITAPQNSLLTGGALSFSATVRNNTGQTLQGKTISWKSSNANVLSISASGVATAVAAGSAQVTATVEGIVSLPFDVVVTSPNNTSKRMGSFKGNSSYNVQGTATLELQGNNLKLVFGSDFRSSNGPRLGVYLAKNAPGVLTASNSVSLGELKSNTGTQEYNVPADVKLTDYDFVVVYCIPFNIAFGFAKLQ